MYMALKIKLKASNERTFLAPSLDFIVGSGLDCDLSLPDVLLDRVHARFYCTLGTWWIEPLSPRTLIRCEGKRIVESTPLRPKTTYQLGNVLITPDFMPRYLDAVEPDGDIIAANDDVEIQPPALSEDQRVRIVASIQKAICTQPDSNLFQALTLSMTSLFPKDSSTAILVYQDGELFPIAWQPEGPAQISFTLARRSALARKSILWERAITSDSLRQVHSLKIASSAAYSPSVIRGQLFGALCVTSEDLKNPLSAKDLAILDELSRILAPTLKKFVKAGGQSVATTFVSYSRADRQQAVHLANTLRKEGISVWMDDRLRVGEDWKTQLSVAVQVADSMVLLLSPESLKSDIVQWEIGVARAANKSILPVALAKDYDPPAEWRSIHYILYEGELSESIRLLCEQIQNIGNFKTEKPR